MAVASSYYDYTSTRTGINRGQVWDIINTGNSSNFFFSGSSNGVIKINQNFINQFFLGFATDNNSDGLIDQPAANSLFDLYGVMQHEIMHLLGFASLLGENGQGFSIPTLLNTVSSYDTFLFNDNQPFVNTINPFGWQPNLIPQNLLNTACPTNYFTGTYNTNQTPILLATDISNNYDLSNLSHLNDDCQTITHIMSPNVAAGAYERLTQEEVNILQDLKYNTNNTYGTILASGANNPNIQNFGTVQIPSIAIDDPCQPIQIDNCNPFTFTFAQLGLLNNDVSDPGFTSQINQIFLIEQYFPNDINFNVDYTNQSITISTNLPFSNFTLGYNTTSPNGVISNTGLISFQVLDCNVANNGSFTCADNLNNCQLICNTNLTCVPCINNNLPEDTFFYYEDYNGAVDGWSQLTDVSSFYTYTPSNPLYNGFFLSPTGSQALITNANVINGNNYILSYIGSGNNNPIIKLTNLATTGYPNTINNINALNSNPFQDITVATVDNNFQQYVTCFQANNNFDALAFARLRFTNVELIIDEFTTPNLIQTNFSNLVCGGQTTIGDNLCAITNAVYQWFDITDSANPIALTNTDGTLTIAGTTAGVVVQNAAGTAIQVNNDNNTYQLVRSFVSSNGVTVNNSCNNASITINTTTDCLDHFITTWQVDNTTTDITIPTHPSESYNYDVDWEGDGIFNDLGVTGNITHDYGTAGTYEVHIRGNFPRIYFGHTLYNPTPEILEVNQWGSQIWTSMNGAFTYCTNLIITANDTPNLSNVTDMTKMFHVASSLNQPLNNWDVSNVTNMTEMFNGTSFNQPLNDWDVSNVTNMVGMFGSAVNFNQPLNNWDVSNVTNMTGMFGSAVNFNQPLNNWDVSNVTNMRGMFLDTNSFNQPLNNWDVSNVTDMGRMFENVTSFNQSLNNWNVSNVNVMSGMFKNATSFNQPLNNWNVSNVYSMYEMFSSAISFNQPLGDWDISNVGSYYDMLNNTNLTTFNYDNLLIGWNQLPNLPQNVNINLGFINSTYCTGAGARQNLISTYYWTINDQGLAPGCRIANNSNLKKDNIKIFPNPTASMFNIEFIDQSVLNFKVEIQNMLGITVLECKDKKVIDISALNTNVYFIKITTNTGEIYLRRIVKE